MCQCIPSIVSAPWANILEMFYMAFNHHYNTNQLVKYPKLTWMPVIESLLFQIWHLGRIKLYKDRTIGWFCYMQWGLHNIQKLSWFCTQYNNGNDKSVAVTPLQTLWSNCRLVLGHENYRSDWIHLWWLISRPNSQVVRWLWCEYFEENWHHHKKTWLFYTYSLILWGIWPPYGCHW